MKIIKQIFLIFTLGVVLISPTIFSFKNNITKVVNSKESRKSIKTSKVPQFKFNEQTLDIGNGKNDGEITYEDVWFYDGIDYKKTDTLKLLYSSNVTFDGVELTIDWDSSTSELIKESSHSIVFLPKNLTKIEQMNYLFTQWQGSNDDFQTIDSNGNISFGKTSIFSNLIPGDEIKLGIIKDGSNIQSSDWTLAEPLILNISYNSKSIFKTNNFYASDIRDDLFWDVKNEVYYIRYKKKEIKETNFFNKNDIKYGGKNYNWELIKKINGNFLNTYYNKKIGEKEYTFFKTFINYSSENSYFFNKNVITNTETLFKADALNLLNFSFRLGSEMNLIEGNTIIWLKLDGDVESLNNDNIIDKEIKKQEKFINDSMDFTSIKNIENVVDFKENELLGLKTYDANRFKVIDETNSVYVPINIVINNEAYSIEQTSYGEMDDTNLNVKNSAIKIFNEVDEKQQIKQILNNLLFAIRRNEIFYSKEYYNSLNDSSKNSSINLHGQDVVRAMVDGKLKESFLSNSEIISISLISFVLFALLIIIIYFIIKEFKEKTNIKILGDGE